MMMHEARFETYPENITLSILLINTVILIEIHVVKSC